MNWLVRHLKGRTSWARLAVVISLFSVIDVRSRAFGAWLQHVPETTVWRLTFADQRGALTTQPKAAQFAYTIGQTAAPIIHGEEKATQTYKAGAFVIDDDSGLITESTSPIDASAVAKRTIGMARDAATGTTSADVSIFFATQTTVFEGTLSDATAGTHTLAATDKFKVYPITKGDANWYLDANAVSDTGGGLVIGFKDPVGTVDGRVYFIPTSTVRGGKNAASGVFSAVQQPRGGSNAEV